MLKSKRLRKKLKKTNPCSLSSQNMQSKKSTISSGDNVSCINGCIIAQNIEIKCSIGLNALG